jgi:glycosyltransferase involved in cell wall biosynthesis
VYNEIRTLETLLTAVLNAPLPCERELVIVDDCSRDGSREFLQEFAKRHDCVRLVLHEKNGGKGQAIRTAIQHMTGDWAVIQDADLEYDPREYQALLEPVLDGVADAVFGSRFLVGRYARAMFFWHTVANKILTLTVNVLSDLNLTDMETCYKLIRADILKHLNLRSKGFDLEPELAIKLARWGARIYEVPISYRGRTYAEGKKIGAKDAVRALTATLRYRFFDRQYCDNEGFLILQSLDRARLFNRWLFSKIEKWLGDEVLEAGCGIGTLTKFVLNRKRLVCVDADANYVDRIEKSYGHLANVTVRSCDLGDREALRSAADTKPLDSVFCTNVLEHVENDAIALQNIHDVLAQGGRAVVLVPNNPGMYSEIDKSLGHYRRYSSEELRSKMEKAGFRVVSCEGFNRVGGLGWRISGRLLKKKTLPKGQMRMFELAMPVVRVLEKVPFHCHNSLICVGERVDQNNS